jgi:hypothetical protein
MKAKLIYICTKCVLIIVLVGAKILLTSASCGSSGGGGTGCPGDGSSTTYGFYTITQDGTVPCLFPVTNGQHIALNTATFSDGWRLSVKFIGDRRVFCKEYSYISGSGTGSALGICDPFVETFTTKRPDTESRFNVEVTLGNLNSGCATRFNATYPVSFWNSVTPGSCAPANEFGPLHF